MSGAISPDRLENSPELLIAGLMQTYCFEERGSIPRQWERFAPAIGSIPGQVGRDSFGVCTNFQPGCGFDYLTGVKVASIEGLPQEYSHIRLPAARYAVFAHRGHVSQLDRLLDEIWNGWARSTDDVAEAPCFERYTAAFDPLTMQGGIEIWIPLRACDRTQGTN